MKSNITILLFWYFTYLAVVYIIVREMNVSEKQRIAILMLLGVWRQNQSKRSEHLKNIPKIKFLS